MFQTKRLNFKNSKSQAAMEFLMTYGWALLVVLIVLAGLAYFGILNISQFLPDKIDMAPGLVAQKFFLSAEDNSLTIYLANGVGAPITNLQMTFPCQNGSLSSTIDSLPSGKTDTIKIYCPMTEGSRFRGNINVTYNTREMQRTFSRRFTGFASVYIPKSNCPTTMNGVGTLANPKQICDCQDLQSMNLILNSNYALIQDIDCKFDTQHPLGFSYNNNNGFMPVGNGTSVFTGSFTGLNHTISNLYINRSTADYVGLFGYMSGGISDVGLINVDVTGNSYVGGLVGSFTSGTIANSYSSGSVHGNESVGGLAGYSNVGVLTRSYFSGDVHGAGDVGGIVGFNSGGILNRTYSKGDVGGSGNVAKGFGGLAGGQSTGITTNSYSFAVLHAQDEESYGGLIGRLQSGRISNSYFAGSVTGLSYKGRGGLMGDIWSQGVISDSFSVGTISYCNQDCGGISGLNHRQNVGQNNGTIINCYWYSYFGGPNKCYHDGNTNCTSFTSLSPFQGSNVASNPPLSTGNWDFTTVWQTNSDYPTLRNMP